MGGGQPILNEMALLMKKEKNRLQDYHFYWRQYLVEMETSSSFIVPFFGCLEEVFSKIKIYRNTVCTKEIVSDTVLSDAIFYDLGGRFLHISRFVFVNELQNLKEAELLIGSDSHSRFVFFLRMIAEPNYLKLLFSKYPILKENIKNQSQLFLKFYKKIVKNYNHDYGKIKKTFYGTKKLVLTKISRSGDIHENGRSVCLFKYRDKANKIYKLVYKPKNLSSDRLYNKLLSWCSHELSVDFKTPIYLYRKNYGWMEFIFPGEFSHKNDIETYFYKFGIVLAVSYLLLGKDFHAHNIIASMDGPILIDLECILTPYIAGFSKTENFLLLNTMLLPQKRLSNADFSGFDMSALSSVINKYHINEQYIAKNEGLDTLTFVKHKRLIPVAHNLPILSGEEVKSFLFQTSIESGFSSCYQLLCHNKEWLTSSKKSPLANAKTVKPRIVFRNTNEYNCIIQELYQSENMQCTDKKEKFLLNIQKTNINTGSLEISKHEKATLKTGVIPTFWASSLKKQIVSGQSTLIAFLPKSPLDRLNAHLADFNASDLNRQIHIIKQALYCYEHNQKLNMDLKSSPIRCHDKIEELIKNQIRILLDLIFIEKGGQFYWTIIQANSHHKLYVSKTGIDVPDGALGILLVITQLANALQLSDVIEKIKIIYKALIATPFHKIQQNASNLGFAGVGGVIYAVTCIEKIIGFRSTIDRDYLENIITDSTHRNDKTYYTGWTGLLASLRNVLEDDDTLQSLIKHEIYQLKEDIPLLLSKGAASSSFFCGLTPQIYLLSKYENTENFKNILIKKILKNSLHLQEKNQLFDLRAMDYGLLANSTDMLSDNEIDLLHSSLKRLSHTSGSLFSDTYQILQNKNRMPIEILKKLKDEFIYLNVALLETRKNLLTTLSSDYMRGRAGLLYSLAQLALDLRLEKITIMGIDKK